MDVGQGEATQLYQAAVSGTIRIEPGAAAACAAEYQAIADMLEEETAAASRLNVFEGYGGFVSSTQLAEGFNKKSAEAYTVLRAHLEAALRMKAAFLAAAGKFDEADAANAAAMRVAAPQVNQ